MPIKIQRINEDKCILGESPFWDAQSQSVYFVDIRGKTVHRYTPSTNAYVKATVGEKSVGFIIPIEGTVNTFVVGHGNEIVKLEWDGVSDKIGSLETIAKLKDGDSNTQFNDSKADPSGRLWTGTFTLDATGFRKNEGSLYALKSDNTLHTLLSPVTISNGLVWNEKLNKFYYIDSTPGEVYQFDYQGTEITRREVIFKFSDNGIEGAPDGMTIDTDGNLWIASFGGAKVIKIDPRKPNTLLQVIDIPVKQVTCVEFGGANYDEMYVTTAAFTVDNTPPPEGGWTYKITGLGVKGVPARRVKL